MKKSFAMYSIVFSLLILTGCKASNEHIAKYPVATALDDYEAREKIMNQNPIDETTISNINRFAQVSSTEILKEESNQCYSPLSLYFALGLVSMGSANQSESEMMEVLQASNLSKEDFAQQMGNLYRLSFQDNEGGFLKIANSLWIKDTMKLKDDFLKQAHENFYASAFSVDFEDAAVSKKMSDWVTDQTDGLITPKIKIDKDTVLEIFNTIHFKANWESEFLPEENQVKPFYDLNGNASEKEFMNKTFASYPFMDTETYSSASLKLSNQSKMTFVLPKEGTSVQEIVTNKEVWENVVNGNHQEEVLHHGEVKLSLPKFSYETKLNLTDTLKKLGMPSVFDDRADFSLLSDEAVFVSRVNQDTSVTLNEQGVDAAAFTSVAVATTSLPVDEGSLDLNLNRPFFYILQNDAGVVLFSGVVYLP